MEFFGDLPFGIGGHDAKISIAIHRIHAAIRNMAVAVPTGSRREVGLNGFGGRRCIENVVVVL
jgi:hypothetical protein